MAKSTTRDSVAELMEAQTEATEENKSEESEQSEATDEQASVHETQVEPAQDAQLQNAEEATPEVRVVLNADFDSEEGSVRVAVPGFDEVELTEEPVSVSAAHAQALSESPAAKVVA